MQKNLKIVLFLLVLGLFSLFFYYLLSSPKNIEIKQSIVQENSGNSEISNDSDDPETDLEKSEETQKSEEIAEQKTESTEKTPKKEESTSQIIQKLVSWGYSSAKNRSIDTIIIHSSYNALGGDKYDFDKLLEEYKNYGVSPHYLIDRKGNIYRLVSDKNIAYHAGESKMPDGRTNVNNFSLGVEIMNTEKEGPTASQYSSLNKLISQLKTTYKIKNVLGHSQIASGRKTDPWNFSWSKVEK